MESHLSVILSATVILIVVLFVSSEALSGRLKNFEIVEAERIVKRRIKRGLNKADASKYNRIDEVQFHAFDRNFRLILTPKRGLLSHDFQAHLVTYNDGVEASEHIHIDEDEFLEGHLHGEEWSRISAHFDNFGALSALVETKDNTFIFEPAWRHFDSVNNSATLVYRDIDVSDEISKSLGKVYCGDTNYLNNSLPHIKNALSHRTKRQTLVPPPDPKLTRCPIKIVADYKFHKIIGDGNRATTSRYLINAIDRINTIFLNTVWKDSLSDNHGLTGLGFIVKEVRILDKPNPVGYNKFHYNMKNDQAWNVVDLLSNFSSAEGGNEKDFCLAHLFTYQAFQGGVLGLGYIGSAGIGGSGVGGICSASAQSRYSPNLVYYNAALSSARSSFGGTVVTREADIVTAHELGHNWGSVHDEPKCTPSLTQGGPYIMNTYSVSGFDPNNKKFSPCSVRAIKNVLWSKKDRCFKEQLDKYCGNQRMELDEECDAGVFYPEKVDKCCDQFCKLKNNSQCSPKNHECCENDCNFSRSSRKCRNENRNECTAASFCRGDGPECPEPRIMRDGTPCLEDGECRKGVCVSFCEKLSIGMKPCMCTNVEDSCYRCCRKVNSNECRAYTGPFGRDRKIRLNQGIRCIHGFCDEKGTCIKSSQDVITHFWNIITKLDGSSFTKFMRDNLVMTIVMITLIVWIPISCIVNQIDKRHEKEMLEEEDWQTSNSMVAEPSRIQVVPQVVNFLNHSYVNNVVTNV